jgi:D-lyxose ketol-isomerase
MSDKPELEFTPAEAVEWTPVAGNATGLYERILASADLEAGVVTRQLRFEPGTDTTANGVLTHDFWEEVYILEGDLTDLRLGQTFTPGMYACRPPGMEHGPWTTEAGCLTFEVRYWGDARR